MLDDLTELPEEWEICTFGDLFDIKGGNQPPKSEFIDSPQAGYIRLLQIRDFESDKLAIYIKDNERLPKCSIHDLLIARYGASLGRICTGKSGSYNVALTKVIFDHDSLDRDWVKLFLESDWFQAPLFLVSRSAQNGFNKDELFPRPVPLPPLNEQKRIVAKIEELRSHTQAARNAIAHIPKLLEQFRQSVLAAAFRGDLTAEWRSENPDVEAAEVLLERIRKERRDRLSQISKSSKYQEAVLPDLDTLVDLPNYWTWATLDQIFVSLRNGLSKPPLEESPGVAILRISAVRAREVNIEDIRFYQIEPDENIDSYLLQSGDLLFTRYNGSRAFVGVCGLVRPFKDKLVYPDKLIRARLVNPNFCLPEFIEFACNIGYSRHHIENRIKTSAGQHGVSGGDIKSAPIPLPPTLEQIEIIRIVEKQLKIIDRIEQQYQFIKTELDRLDRSILAKAFKGELVPQDPTDEPAIVLLERIRNDRASQTSKKVKRSKK